METIGNSQLWSLLSGSEKASSRVSNNKIRADEGHRVTSYLELVRKVSDLQFRNREYVLLFRGQGNDYRNRSFNTTLRPTMLRTLSAGLDFERLITAEQLLIAKYHFGGAHRLRRHQALRWALLQHYEVCPTPLLDVTQSLRIAASFASLSGTPKAFVYVLGVPNISGAITASDEAGLEVIRLSSVCPPEAVRPHIQEGYLLSEYPELSDLRQKEHYENHELDFAKRLVAKFVFEPVSFWGANSAFPMIPREALYPTAPHDPVLDLANEIKSAL